MGRTIQEIYDAALDKIYALDAQVQQLTSEIEQLRADVNEQVIEADDEWEQLDVVIFLREIGFDPDNLPSSLGERMAIRDAIAAAKVR